MRTWPQIVRSKWHRRWVVAILIAVVLFTVWWRRHVPLGPVSTLDAMGPFGAPASFTQSETYFRWKDLSRKELLATCPSEDLLTQYMDRNDGALVGFETVVAKGSGSSIITFDLEEEVGREAAPDQWTSSTQPVHWMLSGLGAAWGDFAELMSRDGSPTGNWANTFGWRLLARRPEVIQYRGKSFVAVLTCCGARRQFSLIPGDPGGTSLIGPFYLQVFDTKARRIGPSYQLSSARDNPRVGITWLPNDPVLIAFEWTNGRDTSRWWIVDMKTLLDAAVNASAN